MAAAGGRGAWGGLSLRTGRDDLLRAALEGVAVQVATALAALPGPGIGAALLVGGGARDARFRQLLADVCGVALIPLSPASEAGSAVGAARLAGQAVGLDVPLTAQRSPPVEPGPGRDAYGVVRARFAALATPTAP